MIRSTLLEVLNGGFFILSLIASAIFLYYIWQHRRMKYRCLQPAIALTCMFIGQTLLRFYVWWLRDQVNSGSQVLEDPIILTISSGTIAIGVLCVIRVFSPEAWGNKPWVIAILAVIAFSIFTVTN